MNTMHRRTFHHILAGVSIAALALLAVPSVVMWSWNLVIPEVFGATFLTFRNALGLVLLGLAGSYLLKRPVLSRRRRHSTSSEREEA